MTDFEIGILDFIQIHLSCAFGDIVMPVVTRLGDAGIIWIATAIILLLIPKMRKFGVAIGISLIIELICCNLLLKPLVARVRPYDVNTAVQLLISPPSDFSFPSGHTCAAFSSASALYFGKSKLWIPAFVLASIIAFSRLYLYVHYPSDVLAGMLLGILFGYLGNKIQFPFCK